MLKVIGQVGQVNTSLTSVGYQACVMYLIRSAVVALFILGQF